MARKKPKLNDAAINALETLLLRAKRGELLFDDFDEHADGYETYPVNGDKRFNLNGHCRVRIGYWDLAAKGDRNGM